MQVVDLSSPEKQRQPSALLGVGEDSSSLPHCILSLEHHDIREQPHRSHFQKIQKNLGTLKAFGLSTSALISAYARFH